MKKILTLFFVFSVAICLAGCTKEGINFNRESQVGKVLDSFSKPKDTTQKSGGMIIIKEKSNNKDSIMPFGPSEINFDMPPVMK